MSGSPLQSSPNPGLRTTHNCHFKQRHSPGICLDVYRKEFALDESGLEPSRQTQRRVSRSMWDIVLSTVESADGRIILSVIGDLSEKTRVQEGSRPNRTRETLTSDRSSTHRFRGHYRESTGLRKAYCSELQANLCLR
jgi:hypothetical protein